MPPLPESPPLLLTHPERLRLGLASQHVLSWGCGGRDGMGAGIGWQSVGSGKAGIVGSTARLPCLPPLPSPPAAVGGPSRPPGSTITHPSAPCHLLKISPTLFWFIFCSDVCSPHAHLRPLPPKKHKKTKRKTGVNWGAERPSWASCPSMMV